MAAVWCCDQIWGELPHATTNGMDPETNPWSWWSSASRCQNWMKSYEELILIYFDVKRCWVLRDIWASCPFSPSPLCSIFLFEWSPPSLMSSQDKGAAQRAATPCSSPLVSLARTKLDSAIQVVCKRTSSIPWDHEMPIAVVDVCSLYTVASI